jgi:lipoprotein-releasing system ATP-binding protein
MNPPLLRARGIDMVYRGGDGVPVPVLQGLQLEVRAGEFVAIIGESGVGKSTLLHILGALDQPSAGEVALDGVRYGDLDAEALSAFRNRRIGFVFQFHHLLRDFSARENVAMPLRIAGLSPGEALRQADLHLETVGVAHRASHRPAQLSGGEQQRVAVARALAAEPALVLADEPSGNLDAANSARLHDLLASVARAPDRALIVVTHNRALAERADRVLILEQGILTEARAPEVVD